MLIESKAIDFNRLPRGAFAERDSTAKEWVHTTLHGPGWTLAINAGRFAFGEDVRDVLTCLVFRGNACHGVLESAPSNDANFLPGDQAHAVEGCRSAPSGMGSALTLNVPALDLRAELKLSPMCGPAAIFGRHLSGDGVLHWVVTPRLLATGTLMLGGIEHRCEDVLCYRDRNWGQFSFGAASSWDWGYVLPSDPSVPWSVVFGRVLDTSRSTTEQSLLLWHGSRLAGIFRNQEVSLDLDTEPLGRGPDAILPGALSLCRDGDCVDLPRRGAVSAQSSAGQLKLTFDVESVARLVLPRDGGVGTAIIHEALVRFTVQGTLDSRAIEFDGMGFLERSRG